MLSKPCGELYCHALAYCDMCGRLPFSTEYKLKVSGPQGAGAALCVLCIDQRVSGSEESRGGSKEPLQCDIKPVLVAGYQPAAAPRTAAGAGALEFEIVTKLFIENGPIPKLGFFLPVPTFTKPGAS